jgi:hypothetical protein
VENRSTPRAQQWDCYGWGSQSTISNLVGELLERSAQGRDRENLGTKWLEGQPRWRAFWPWRHTLCNQPSPDGSSSQLGARRLGLPERPSEIDLDPLAIGKFELDPVPARHEVAVPVTF